MKQAHFPLIKSWILPEAAFTRALEDMARDGRDGNEGVALWLGRRRDEQAHVTHIVLLRGAGVVKKFAFLQVEPWLLNEVTDVAIENDVRIIGQIHSHGHGWSTDLSSTDRAGGFAVPHFLSVVAPDYALRPSTTMLDCGVHVFEAGSGYRRLSSEEIERRIKVVPQGQASVLIVGDK